MVKSAEADKGKPAQPAVSYFRLYNADSLDCIAIALGILGALANGPVQPLFAYIFGEVQSCRLLRVHAVCSQYQYCRLVPARVLTSKQLARACVVDVKPAINIQTIDALVDHQFVGPTFKVCASA